ncbi:MAG TPA: YkgJ family cysteine cluster protein [Acidimicrobiales bacterium]|nr:YkgJ family cysteine cluster protein [Acidimicrobiales bacterium]
MEEQLDAGQFSVWLVDMQAALRGEVDADVPCNGCTACCRSSMFIHIEPDELDTLAHIPKALLFPAPRRPHGHVVLGHDERGHCPMLVDDKCSIYEHRPRTCRTYDCRVFAATGLDAADGDERKSEIAQRVELWRFEHRTEDDRSAQAAVLDAVVTIRNSAPDLTNAELAARAVLRRTGVDAGE